MPLIDTRKPGLFCAAEEFTDSRTAGGRDHPAADPKPTIVEASDSVSEVLLSGSLNPSRSRASRSKLSIPTPLPEVGNAAWAERPVEDSMMLFMGELRRVDRTPPTSLSCSLRAMTYDKNMAYYNIYD